jgi:hypothetical protein
MGGLETWRRTGVLAATLALHVAAVIMLVAAFHREARAPSTTAFVSTLIVLPPPVRSEPPERALRMSSNDALVPLHRAEPPPLVPLPITPARDAGTIDWSGQGRAAAADQAEGMTGREINPRNADDGASAAPPPAHAHTKGEQYRTDTGDSIVWISDRCYVISENPPPGTPQAVARSRPTRTVCPRDSSEARGDLFDDAQAFRKRHPH